MTKLLLFCSLLLLSNNSRGQCLFAKYKVTIGPTMLSGVLPVKLNVIYNVWADSNFIEIIGVEDSITSDFPVNFNDLKKKSTDEHIVIERRTGVGFFVKTEKYVIVKEAQILSKVRIDDCYILELNNESRIKICKNTNSLMTPGILFDIQQNPYGVEWFKSKSTVIKIASKISASDRQLNHKSLFDSAKFKVIVDTVDFFKN